MSISSRLAGLACRVCAPPSPDGALESVPRVLDQPVQAAYVRPFSPPVGLDWRLAASPSADNPMPGVPQSAAPRRWIVTWDEVEREVRAKYANRLDQYIGEPPPTGDPPPEAPVAPAPSPAAQPSDRHTPLDIDPPSVAQGEPIVRDEGDLPASRETLPTEHEKGTGDASVGPGAADNAPVDDSPLPVEVGQRRPMSGAERMRRRRAELRRLGLPAETKGRLKSLKVTATAPAAEIVTAAIAPTAEIVTAADTPTTPTAGIVTPTIEIVTAAAEIVTPNGEAADVC
jgi:hypothetical protein